MNPKLLALYGLKFDPFSPEVPTEALYRSPKIESFCWRIGGLNWRPECASLISASPTNPFKQADDDHTLA